MPALHAPALTSVKPKITLPRAKDSLSPFRAIIATLAIVGAACMGIAWAVASPVGASPDDDYHLGSIWCPPPISESGCNIGVRDGEPAPLVPRGVADNSPCYAFHPENSAYCRLDMSDSERKYTNRYDAGNYPYGYYQFHHLFVQPHVNTAVLTMRSVNVLLAVVLVSCATLLSPVSLRRPMAISALVAWMPMGIYFIASNNPSSWSLTGIYVYTAALLGAVSLPERQENGWKSLLPSGRGIALLGVATLGAVMSFTSRADSAFFISVISLAVCLRAIQKSKKLFVPGALALVLSLIGLKVTLGTNQASINLAADQTVTPPSTPILFLRNLIAIPEYIAGFYGHWWWPGWMDVPFDGPIETLGLTLGGAALILGSQHISIRKTLASMTILGAIVGIPVALGVIQKNPDLVAYYQPRYMLPLFAPLLLMWFSQYQPVDIKKNTSVLEDAEPNSSTKQENSLTPFPGITATVMVAVIIVTIQGFGLLRLMERYTHGIQPGLRRLNLNLAHAWWWHTYISPMHVYMMGMLGLILLTICTLIIPRKLPSVRHSQTVESSINQASSSGEFIGADDAFDDGSTVSEAGLDRAAVESGDDQPVSGVASGE